MITNDTPEGTNTPPTKKAPRRWLLVTLIGGLLVLGLGSVLAAIFVFVARTNERDLERLKHPAEVSIPAHKICRNSANLVDKVIEVTCKVDHVNASPITGGYVEIRSGPSPDDSILVYPSADSAARLGELRPGQQIRVKGICRGVRGWQFHGETIVISPAVID